MRNNIFSNIPSSSSRSSNAVIAGSSNLTGSGLASNLELNLGRFNPEIFNGLMIRMLNHLI